MLTFVHPLRRDVLSYPAGLIPPSTFRALCSSDASRRRARGGAIELIGVLETRAMPLYMVHCITLVYMYA
jgi:hypothetical protein